MKSRDDIGDIIRSGRYVDRHGRRWKIVASTMRWGRVDETKHGFALGGMTYTNDQMRKMIEADQAAARKGHSKGSALDIQEFLSAHPVDRVQVERRKKRMLGQLAAMEALWGELTFAWVPTKTTQGWVWMRRVWRIHQADGQTRYEKAKYA